MIGMEIDIRKARNGDLPALPQIFRNANDTLRQSRGGTHPDSDVDMLNRMTDSELLGILRRGAVIFVAEVKGTNQLAGMGAITDNLPARLMGSTYSRNHYVLESFQKGKSGVSVGRLLREATLAEARRLGFRKIYGYSTPEAAGYHKKFGAVFYPRYNSRLVGTVVLQYYEIELRKSILNSLHVEPYVYRAGMLLGSALGFIRRRMRSGR